MVQKNDNAVNTAPILQSQADFIRQRFGLAEALARVVAAAAFGIGGGDR